MKPVHLLVILFIFCAGMAAGWWLAMTRTGLQPTDAGSMAFTPPPMLVVAPTTHDAPVLWLTVEYEGGSTQVPAARIKHENLLLASLYNVYPANAIYWTDPESDAPVFLNVSAADHASQLIAFEFYRPDAPRDPDSTQSITTRQDLSDRDGLTLSNDSGSLFLGKEVLLELPGQRLDATIESSLNRDQEGIEYYHLKVPNLQESTGGPLRDPSSGELVGFVIQQREPIAGELHNLVRAVDAAQIGQLLDLHRFDVPMRARAFSEYWAGTTDGLRISIAQLLRLERWSQAYEHAELLWSQVTDYLDRDRILLTTSAYLTAQQLVDHARPAEALSLAGDMERRFPGRQLWCLVLARAYEAQSKWQQALRSTQTCLDLPVLSATHTQPSVQAMESRANLITRYHHLARTLATDPAMSFEIKQQALLKALEFGKQAELYRLLGDVEFDAKQYPQAQTHYRLAISLDPALAAPLEVRLQNARQRSTTTPTAYVPYEQRRGAIIVEARVNDSPQSFRFLVDTGATYSAVSAATLLRLGLGQVFANGAPVIELESAAGRIYAQRFDLASIQVGAARVERVPVVILENLEGVDGLLGLSFLDHFDVNLDQQAGKLILTRR